jgi:uncharacterized protein (DUF302 family)
MPDVITAFTTENLQAFADQSFQVRHQFQPTRRKTLMRPLRYAAFLSIATMLSAAGTSALAVDGLITKPSAHTVDQTIEKFEAAVKKRGFMVFARLDHAAGAESVGLKMPRATVIVFGNPRLGTPVFLKTPTLAIDLPPRALVWEDSNGKVFLSYNSAQFLYGSIYVRHGIQSDKAVAEKVEAALAAIADDVVK